jgi:prolyl-tRNA editing enzyme YbaK/EbsC (Cys-tRNA(Pro) deacylase)
MIERDRVAELRRRPAVSLSGMEYGGITPAGLPAAWPILIDEQVLAARVRGQSPTA